MKQRTGKRDKLDLRFIQNRLHRVHAPEAAHHDDGAVDCLRNFRRDRGEISLVDVRLDPADGSAVAADFNGVDPRPIQQLTDGNALCFIQTSENEIAGIDLDRDVERRGSLTDAVHDLQQNPAAILSGPAVLICAVIGCRRNEVERSSKS